jgi:RNA binding exosome subunit
VYALVAIHNFINSHYSVEDNREQFEPYYREEEEVLTCEFDDSDGIEVVMDERREEIANQLWRSYWKAIGRPYES